MSANSEKIKRGIASFNNQITRITKIKESFSEGNKVREHLEAEIKELIKDRDVLSSFTSKSFTDSFTIPKVSKTVDDIVIFSESVGKVLKKVKKIDEEPYAEMLRRLTTIEKSTHWKKTFYVSLSASVVGLVIGIAIGYVLP